jgi:hypothetical protein
MGKVSCFDLEGIYCWFNSLEHRPPHFHARRKGQWHVRVFFLNAESNMIERAKGPEGRMGKNDRNALCEQARLNREKLLGEWEQKVCCDA